MGGSIDFRMTQLAEYFTDGINGLLLMKKALLELAGLRSVTVEEAGRGPPQHRVAAMGTTPVFVRTCTSADGAAMQDRRHGGSPAGQRDTLPPASPFWCLEEYQHARTPWLAWNELANVTPAAQCVAVFEGKPLLAIIKSPMSSNRSVRPLTSEMSYFAMAISDDEKDTARKESDANKLRSLMHPA